MTQKELLEKYHEKLIDAVNLIENTEGIDLNEWETGSKDCIYWSLHHFIDDIKRKIKEVK